MTWLIVGTVIGLTVGLSAAVVMLFLWLPRWPR